MLRSKHISVGNTVCMYDTKGREIYLLGVVLNADWVTGEGRQKGPQVLFSCGYHLWDKVHELQYSIYSVLYHILCRWRLLGRQSPPGSSCAAAGC